MYSLVASLDAKLILEDLELKVRQQDSEEENELDENPLTTEEIQDKEATFNHDAHLSDDVVHLLGHTPTAKLEKQGTMTTGEWSSMVSIPHAASLLSPVQICSMSERELQDVLPKLVAILQQGLGPKRPDWWPHAAMPWTLYDLSRAVKNASSSSLRSLVHKCYNYLTQLSQKSAPGQARVSPQPRVLDWLNSNPPSRSCTQLGKTRDCSNSKNKGVLPYLEIYLCFLCNKEFSTKDTLQKHQLQCSGNTLPLSMPSTPSASEAPSPAPPTVASDDTSSTGVTSSATSHHSTSVASYREFVTALDLVPVHRARKIRQARRRNTECETIDLEEPQTPVAPPTPRTPKLLISQLSRDASASGVGSQGVASRRRLSYLLQSTDKKTEKISGDDDDGMDEDSDAESTESGADDTDEPKLHKKSLFSIDISSALGQRVLKHMTSETHVPVIVDAEQFCKTPIKDKYQDRLRIRQLNYPITWKLTRKRLRQQTHSHLYNFTRAEKFEFMEKMRTGLNFRCRKLLGYIKKCSVVVKRLSMKILYKWKPSLNKISVPLKQLTAEEILFWTQPKPTSPQPCIFPDGPTFMLTDIDRVLGLKRKDGSSEVASKLLVGHCVSESANAELQLQKMTVYRSLLTDLSSSVFPCRGQLSVNIVGSRCSRKVVSDNEKTYPTLFSILSGVKGPVKKVMSGRVMMDVKRSLKVNIPSTAGGLLPSIIRSNRSSPLDDSFSIMSVSSDEDNNKSAACCALCAMRSNCRCPEKPASSSTVCLSRSPAQASKLSSVSLESSVPSDLDSPSTISRMSLFIPPTLSLPNLSPFSQGLVLCPQSPTLTSRISEMTSVLSSSSHLGSSPHQTESSSASFRSESPQAQSPCKLSVSYGPEQRSASSRVCKDSAQPVLAVQRPTTRSSSKESIANEPAETRGQHKTVTLTSDTKNRQKKELSAVQNFSSVNSTAKMELELIPKSQFRFTRSSTQPQERDNNYNRETSAVSVTQNFRCLRKGRSSSGNVERIQKNDKNNNSGHNSCSNSNSSQGNQLNGSKISGEYDRTLRSGNLIGKVQLGAGSSTSKTIINEENANYKTSNGVHTNSEDVLIIRRSSRGNPFASTVDMKKMENGNELVHPKGLKRSVADITSSQNESLINASYSNPFLNSKAQTKLFSSSILEQARRHWNPSPKSPTRDGNSKGILRSGNTFRLSSFAFGSGSFGSETNSQLQWVESTIPLSSSHFSHQNTTLTDSQAQDHNQQVPPTPARKGLSPMQMLSVLESAKGRSPNKCKSTRSPSKHGNSKKRLDRAFTRIMGKGPGYYTRAKESISPAKKGRFGD